MDFLKYIIFLGLALWIYFISSDVAISIVTYNKRVYSSRNTDTFKCLLVGKKELVFQEIFWELNNYWRCFELYIPWLLLYLVFSFEKAIEYIVLLFHNSYPFLWYPFFFLLYLKDIFWDKQAKLIQGVLEHSFEAKVIDLRISV